MTKAYNSRTADKFVVRFPEGLRQSIEEMAEFNRRSMNAEIIRAVEAHVNHQRRQIILLDALEAQQLRAEGTLK